MRAVQGLRAVLDLPLETRVADDLEIPRPGFELVSEPDKLIMAELEGINFSASEQREPVRYHHPSLHELQTSTFAPDTFVGATLEVRKGKQTYHLQFTTDQYGPKIRMSMPDTSYDARTDLTELAFALRAKTGGVFYVPTTTGAVRRESNGQGEGILSTTFYLVDLSNAFSLHYPVIQEHSDGLDNLGRYREWVRTYEDWNPRNARTDFRANGKPRPEGLTGRVTHPRMFMPEPIAFSQHNVAVVVDYLSGLGFNVKIQQLDYKLTRTEREQSSFMQDLRVR